MELAIIAALSENNVIAVNDQMPWHIPEDLKRFRDLTINHPVIMGRKTYESLPEKFRPLPQRTNIVLSQNPTFSPQSGVLIARTIEDATQKAYDTGAKLAYVIGGAEIYRQFMPYCGKMHITRIEQTFTKGNLTFFPEIKLEDWKEIGWEQRDGFSFHKYERIRSAQ